MKTGDYWNDKYQTPLYNGIRSEGNKGFFRKLVARIQADALDSIAAEFEKHIENGAKAISPQVVAELRRRARDIEL